MGIESGAIIIADPLVTRRYHRGGACGVLQKARTVIAQPSAVDVTRVRADSMATPITFDAENASALIRRTGGVYATVLELRKCQWRRPRRVSSNSNAARVIVFFNTFGHFL